MEVDASYGGPASSSGVPRLPICRLCTVEIEKLHGYKNGDQCTGCSEWICYECLASSLHPCLCRERGRVEDRCVVCNKLTRTFCTRCQTSACRACHCKCDDILADCSYEPPASRVMEEDGAVPVLEVRKESI